MLRIERYLFRTAANAFLAGLLTLTGVIWVTQALKQLDLLTSKGQTILVFLTHDRPRVSLPARLIAPVALFASVLYCLNRLNGDSELVVMSASGISPARLLRPFLALFALVFWRWRRSTSISCPGVSTPLSRSPTRIHADFIANFARPGAFTELEAGFIFHYRERAHDGSLRGVFIQDRRDPAAYLDLHRRGRRDRRAGRRDLSRAVEGQRPTAARLRRFRDRHLRRLRDRPVAILHKGDASSGRASARPWSC